MDLVAKVVCTVKNISLAAQRIKRSFDSTVITKERAIELLVAEGFTREKAEEILRT